jgi:hypothetical protein
VNLSRHPRPLLRRNEWTSLDGEWDFAIDGDARWAAPQDVRWDRRIRLPFAPETRASGINDQGMYACVWYRRKVELPPVSEGRRLLLHFGAVDPKAPIAELRAATEGPT